jgi:predicted enzyme related to lactoylglutathione lyase
MPGLLVNIDVDDLERGVDFYVRAFDLRVGRRFGSAVELLGAPAPIYLLEKKAGSAPFAGAGVGRDYRRHWTPVHLDLVVEELEPAIERAERAGARREGDISEQVWGRLALMSDPFGHGFCLLQFQGRGYDEIAE